MPGIGPGTDDTENNKKRSPALTSLQLIKKIQPYKQLYQVRVTDAEIKVYVWEWGGGGSKAEVRVPFVRRCQEGLQKVVL